MSAIRGALLALLAAAGSAFGHGEKSDDIAPPAGYFAARLAGPSEISPGVRLQILPGIQPGIFLENRSGRPVTILGSRGEPFLRVDPGGVSVNLAAKATDEPRWERRSPAPSYAWLEPRLSYPERELPEAIRRGGTRREVRRWEIAFLHGAELRKIGGAIDWVPLH